VIEMARVRLPALPVHTPWPASADPALVEPELETARSGSGDRAIDAVVLGAAFEREAPILLAAARAITFDSAEAEDLVQTTFELAIRNVHQLRDPRAMRAWLLTIQTREAFRTIRRLRRGLGLRGSGGLLDIPIAAVPSTDHIAVRDALRGLPPRMRAVVVLHHMAGMTVPQVARAVGRSENTVRSQLRVGLQRLREALRDD
jgi:RNA polymerase sigma-70 factor (ECF subfamily)